MKKIVIIGAGEFQFPLILKAKKMGFETHVFAWEEGAVGKEIADYFYPISITEKEKILNLCRKIAPVGIISVASDLAVITVNYIARALGLPANPPETDYTATNKCLMRQAFLDAGVHVPKFKKIAHEMEIPETFKMRYPLIVKPTDRSGSRAIFKVSNEQELKNAIHAAIEVSFEKSAIIEEVINGEEYSCECISQNGIHHFLAFTKKYTTGVPGFIETAHLQPSDIPARYMYSIKAEIRRALDALHIKTGASHVEFRIDAHGNMGIIEIGARMGGDYIGTHLVPLSTGYDYLKMVIQAACGEKIELSCWKKHKVSYVRFIMEENDKRLLEQIQKNCPELIQYVTPIEPIGSRRIVDSSTRLGAFILQCNTEEEIQQFT